jgi:hypothetical protein
MRKWLLLGFLAAVACSAGCATVTMSAKENAYQQRYVAELDGRRLADNWNMIWMTHRQTRLTRWHVR